jgi:two-component system, OmpR family, response regulator BaeR
MILIAEDEPKLAQLIADYLRVEDLPSTIVADGGRVLAEVQRLAPQVVLLDVMLPNRDGLTLCREIRAISTVPIVFLTARIEEIDRLLGLDAGADDYICKPFSPREVVARVRAQLRRQQMLKPDSPAEFALDDARHQAHYRGELLNLTPVEFRLLKRLLKQPGRVYSRAALQDGLYLDHRLVSDRTIDSHIKNLRRKLSGAHPGRDPIESVYGVGFKLVERG